MNDQDQQSRLSKAKSDADASIRKTEENINSEWRKIPFAAKLYDTGKNYFLRPDQRIIAFKLFSQLLNNETLVITRENKKNFGSIIKNINLHFATRKLEEQINKIKNPFLNEAFKGMGPFLSRPNRRWRNYFQSTPREQRLKVIEELVNLATKINHGEATKDVFEACRNNIKTALEPFAKNKILLQLDKIEYTYLHTRLNQLMASFYVDDYVEDKDFRDLKMEVSKLTLPGRGMSATKYHEKIKKIQEVMKKADKILKGNEGITEVTTIYRNVLQEERNNQPEEQPEDSNQFKRS